LATFAGVFSGENNAPQEISTAAPLREPAVVDAPQEKTDSSPLRIAPRPDPAFQKIASRSSDGQFDRRLCPTCYSRGSDKPCLDKDRKQVDFPCPDATGAKKQCYKCPETHTCEYPCEHDGDPSQKDGCYACDFQGEDGVPDSCYLCDNDGDGKLDHCERQCVDNDGIARCRLCDADGNGTDDSCYLCDTLNNDGIPDACYQFDTDGDGKKDSCNATFRVVIEFEDNFEGRSQVRAGVGERGTIKIELAAGIDLQDLMPLTSASSDANSVEVDPTTGIFTAGRCVGSSVIKVTDTNGISSSITLNVVEPTDIQMRRVASFDIWHEQGYASLGYRAHMWLRPTDVSFNWVQIREGAGPVTKTGTYTHFNLK